jgi:carbon-monoxide dehydrogenase medium subunit
VKPAPFDYARPAIIGEATRLLADAGGTARVIAGGQSLGPMLNLRLVQPELIVDLRAIGALREVTEAADAIVYGSGVTHASIEDGKVADGTRGFMPRVARGIAYRAIRNRGTLGGSVCHADPAADWTSALLALSAEAIVEGPGGRREMPIEDFVTGAYSTALADDEVLVGVRVARLGAGARWGYCKLSRKPGEFAEAIAAIVTDPHRGTSRIVLGGIGGAPQIIGGIDLARGQPDARRWRDAVSAFAGGDDHYRLQVSAETLARAAAQLGHEPA